MRGGHTYSTPGPFVAAHRRSRQYHPCRCDAAVQEAAESGNPGARHRGVLSELCAHAAVQLRSPPAGPGCTAFPGGGELGSGVSRRPSGVARRSVARRPPSARRRSARADAGSRPATVPVLGHRRCAGGHVRDLHQDPPLHHRRRIGPEDALCRPEHDRSARCPQARLRARRAQAPEPRIVIAGSAHRSRCPLRGDRSRRGRRGVGRRTAQGGRRSGRGASRGQPAIHRATRADQ